MAEIGLIASVIQVAGAGLTLSKTLYQYADSVSSADKRIRDIAQDVKLTSFVIDELGRIFKQDETAVLISKNAINTAEETVRECSNVFTEMEAALKKSKKNTLGRFMLPFLEPKLELLRTNIDRLKSTLQLLMQVLTHAHQIAAQNPDKKKVAAQRQQIKALIQTKKEFTKRYEESLRNYGMSEGNMATNDDDNLGANINDEKHETTNRSINVFRTTSSIGSTITTKGLESCVEHIQKLLKDIEAVQRVLNANIDGTSSTDYEQGLIGAYFRTRSALDSVILGSSSTAKVNSGLGEVMSPKNEQLSLVSMEGEQEENIRLEVALSKTAAAAEGPDMDAFVDFDPSVSNSPSPQNRLALRHPSGFKQQTGLPPFIAPGLSPSEILGRAEGEEDDRARRAAQDAKDLLESKRHAEEESAKLKCPTEEKLQIITFKDAIGRKFSFPFHMCKTWKGVEELINQAFLHVGVIGPDVREGRYDLVGPDDEVILPQLWETAVQPDWVVTMHMWPTPEPPKEQYLPPPSMLDPHMVIIPPPPGAVKKRKKSKKSAAHHGPHPMSIGAPPPPSPPSPPMDVIEVPPPPPHARPGMVMIEHHASRKKEPPISPFLRWTADGSTARSPPKSAAKPESPSSSDSRIRTRRIRRMQKRDNFHPKPPPPSTFTTRTSPSPIIPFSCTIPPRTYFSYSSTISPNPRPALPLPPPPPPPPLLLAPPPLHSTFAIPDIAPELHPRGYEMGGEEREARASGRRQRRPLGMEAVAAADEEAEMRKQSGVKPGEVDEEEEVEEHSFTWDTLEPKSPTVSSYFQRVSYDKKGGYGFSNNKSLEKVNAKTAKELAAEMQTREDRERVERLRAVKRETTEVDQMAAERARRAGIEGTRENSGSGREMTRARARAEEERARARAWEMAGVRASGAGEDSEKEREGIKTAENARTRAWEEWTVKDWERVREARRERERDSPDDENQSTGQPVQRRLFKNGAPQPPHPYSEWDRYDGRCALNEVGAIAKVRARAGEREMVRADEGVAKARAEEMARKAGGEWVGEGGERGGNPDKDDVDELLHEWTTLYTV